MVAIAGGVLLAVGILWAIGLSAVILGFVLDRMVPQAPAAEHSSSWWPHRKRA